MSARMIEGALRALRALRVTRSLRVLVAGAALSAASVASGERLDAAIAAAPAGAWITYEVELVPGDGSPCCFDGGDGKPARRGCALEGRNFSFGTSDRHVRASDVLRVFLRKDAAGVDRVRAFGGDCPVDPGSAVVRRVEGIQATDSVAVLARMVGAGGGRSEKLAAIAMHADDAAGAELARLARSGGNAARGDALFWLAQRSDARAEQAIRAALAPDVPQSLQKKAVFALSQLPEAKSVPALREIVESDRPRSIRKEALFWLAQHDSDEAFAVFDRIFAR